ncbi:hypothetical protein ABT297_39695 [Dactylosporangium sp. NPDC000555]|uniref:hypothetical protein n=1 Tax=Dactylosporangium sp. NPDC000555 TaxID=3154260 RepID=UPI003334A1E4
MRELVAAFGGDLPEADTGTLLGWLDEFSDDHWNFRGRLGGAERDRVRVDLPERLAAAALVAARELGLAGTGDPPHREYAHLLVLGGLARACLQRTEHAARLAAALRVGAVAALGSRRPLGAEERALPGLDGCETEADALAAGARAAFGDRPVDVLTAPSGRGAPRPNTADTYAFWAGRTRPQPDERILVVTSPIYVPFQHCDAIRVLGLRYRCGIDTVGFDPRLASTPQPPGAAGADRYLQEIRSAIRAARALHAACTGASGEVG